jgi:RHS repeat-associated protein
VGAAAPESIAYTYDAQDRVTEACYAATCTDPADPFIRYAYDEVGNRSSETRPSGATTYVYDDSDRMVSKTLGSMTTNYSFDRNGNQTAVGGRTFSWDLANRLKSTSGSGATESYTYDGDGKRLTASTGAAAADSTKYLWDITHGDAELAVERDGANAVRRTYTYGHDRLATRTGGSSSYFHHDAIGSVTNVTSASGGLQWSYGYEPFGAARTTSKDDVDAPANPMRFAGEMLDTHSDLYHLRARQYDPADGRFLATDPLAPSETDPSISTYHYAKNRPAVLIDPSGMGSVWPRDHGGDGCDLSCVGDGLADGVSATANALAHGLTHPFECDELCQVRRPYLGAETLKTAAKSLAGCTLGAGVGVLVAPPVPYLKPASLVIACGGGAYLASHDIPIRAARP